MILGCSSSQLSANERSLFNELQPWGIILFARNIVDPQQLCALISDCKNAMQRSQLMVFIDQEGGRVSRLPKSHWRIPPSPTVFAKMYEHDPQTASQACLLNATLTGLELKALGINANCAPMLDIPQKNTASIITERALGYSPQDVIQLGKQISKGLKRSGVAGVIKHMPGHGRATSDSHLALPRVDASFDELKDWDFIPFKAMADEPMAMSAHIVFEHIDKALPATISPTVIKHIIREEIGFNGLLMTDDLNMHALSGTIAHRAEQAIKAGCDIALHCSGDYQEMKSLVDVANNLNKQALKRSLAAEKIAFVPAPELDANAIQKELDTLMLKYT
jgi:beta-N-acetylhexosaminidase